MPLVKGWSTEMAVDVSSQALQVYGGMGYIEETGIAQLYRDARITTIYEGLIIWAEMIHKYRLSPASKYNYWK